jgi:hypothetical protein
MEKALPGLDFDRSVVTEIQNCHPCPARERLQPGFPGAGRLDVARSTWASPCMG